jgi:hypothetical protein
VHSKPFGILVRKKLLHGGRLYAQPKQESMERAVLGHLCIWLGIGLGRCAIFHLAKLLKKPTYGKEAHEQHQPNA